MRMPKQVKNIDRPIAGPSDGAQNGVGPSFFGGLAATLGPIALKALKGAVQGAIS